MERQNNWVRRLLPVLAICLLLASCGRQEEREFPEQGNPESLAQSESPRDLRITYCKLMKQLYGPKIDCMDGGRAFLDKNKDVIAGVVYDGNYSLETPAKRYLVCMREPTAEGDEGSKLDAIAVQWVDGEWKKIAEKKDFLTIPYLESMRTAASMGQPVVKIGFEDEARKTQYRYLSFGPDSIALLDSFPPVVDFMEWPVCLGESMEGKFSAEKYSNSQSTGGTDFLMTPFERLVADLLPLVDEERMPVAVPEDSITREYENGNTAVSVVQLVEPNGESNWFRVEGELCEGGIETLFSILRAIYPELRPFDLNLKGTFGVVIDHEDFQVERVGGKIVRILYDSFQNGQQSHIEVKDNGEGHLLEFRFYHM